jgi:hypothetical protein
VAIKFESDVFETIFVANKLRLFVGDDEDEEEEDDDEEEHDVDVVAAEELI